MILESYKDINDIHSISESALLDAVKNCPYIIYRILSPSPKLIESAIESFNKLGNVENVDNLYCELDWVVNVIHEEGQYIIPMGPGFYSNGYRILCRPAIL